MVSLLVWFEAGEDVSRDSRSHSDVRDPRGPVCRPGRAGARQRRPGTVQPVDAVAGDSAGGGAAAVHAADDAAAVLTLGFARVTARFDRLPVGAYGPPPLLQVRTGGWPASRTRNIPG